MNLRPTGENTTVLDELMNKSQDSIATLYDASCPELDRLTSLMRQYVSMLL
jgi:galactokinase